MKIGDLALQSLQSQLYLHFLSAVDYIDIRSCTFENHRENQVEFIVYLYIIHSDVIQLYITGFGVWLEIIEADIILLYMIHVFWIYAWLVQFLASQDVVVRNTASFLRLKIKSLDDETYIMSIFIIWSLEHSFCSFN